MSEIDFRDSSNPSFGYLALVLGAVKMFGYDAVKKASLTALSEVPGIDSARLAAFALVAEKKRLETEDDVLLFLNFVFFGDWQAEGVPVVGVLSPEERLGVVEVICGACKGLLQSEIDRLQVLVDLVPEMPEGYISE